MKNEVKIISSHEIEFDGKLFSCKRKRGRPVSYQTDDERRLARNKNSVAHRLKLKAKRLQAREDAQKKE
jgi:hypothetical protein